MKKELLTLATAIIFGGFGFGQNIFPTTGNVGIGTTNPSGILDIKTKDTDKEVYLIANFSRANQNSHSPRLNFVGEYQKAGYGIQAINVNAHGRKDLVFYSHDTDDYSTYNEAVRFTHKGNVGIGTANPTSKLTLGYNNADNQLGFQRADGAEVFSMSINTLNQMEFKNKSGGADYNFITNLGGKSLESVLFIEGYNGNIGIGTISPDEKLTVKGKIHAEEVRVDLSVPADYVFEKYYTGKSELKADYVMPTLEEVETFTKANNHLPNIPSAKEIQEEGLHLKEMTNLLLQKIEELTLYTIEQQKQLEKQAQQLEVQQKEIQALKEK